MNKQGVIDYVKALGGIETPEGWNVPKGVSLSFRNFTEIPIKFNIVQGNFWCSYNLLTSLKGCPKLVEGYFDCSCNQLTSFKYSPKQVKDTFYCDKGNFKGKAYYDFLLQEKVISEVEYLLAII